jgi:hypothetical protein
MTVRNKRITLYIAYCIVVIALILIITLIFRPSPTDVVTKTKQTTTAQHPAGKSAGNGANTKIASNGGGKSSVSTRTTTTIPTKLNNTGPGNVFGLFAAVSLVGAWFYRRKLIRTV